MTSYIRRVVPCVLVDTSMSGASEAEAKRFMQSLAGMIFTKIREVEDVTKSLVGKVEDGAFDLVLNTRDIMTIVNKIEDRVEYYATVHSTSITGVELGVGRIYGEVTRLGDDVAVLALMVHQLKQLVVMLIFAILMMLFVLISVVPLVPVEQTHETLFECSNNYNMTDGMIYLWNVTQHLNQGAVMFILNLTP